MAAFVLAFGSGFAVSMPPFGSPPLLGEDFGFDGVSSFKALLVFFRGFFLRGRGRVETRQLQPGT